MRQHSGCTDEPDKISLRPTLCSTDQPVKCEASSGQRRLGALDCSRLTTPFPAPPHFSLPKKTPFRTRLGQLSKTHGLARLENGLCPTGVMSRCHVITGGAPSFPEVLFIPARGFRVKLTRQVKKQPTCVNDLHGKQLNLATKDSEDLY